MPDQPDRDIAEFRAHFGAIYIASIPKLLDESGLFLGFLASLTAVDALAGVWAPNLGSGERFKGFVAAYFPEDLRNHCEELWKFRNSMVHSMNPGPFALVSGQSQLHLSRYGHSIVLNAQDFYATLVIVSKRYFLALTEDGVLKANFHARLADAGGGAPDTHVGVRVV